jgi:general secretion pathway protein N
MLVGLSAGIAADHAASEELTTRNELMTEPNLNLTAPLKRPLQNSATPTVSLPAGNLWPPQAINRPNPLWAIPIASLTNTRERPIFLPSRRPPPQLASPAPQAQQSARGDEPDRPLLTLVGTVAGTAEGIAIFQDENSKDIVRLRTGESHAGWTLTAVRAREVNLLHNRRTAILAIPSPSAD